MRKIQIKIKNGLAEVDLSQYSSKSKWSKVGSYYRSTRFVDYLDEILVRNKISRISIWTAKSTSDIFKARILH